MPVGGSPQAWFWVWRCRCRPLSWNTCSKWDWTRRPTRSTTSTPRPASDRLRECDLRARAADRGRLRLTLRWCQLKQVADPDEAATWGDHERGALADCDLPVGGAGTPLVAAYAAAPLGAALGVSTQSATSLMSDALDLAWRLPRLHAQVEDLTLPLWKARRVAEATTALSVEAAAFVDDQLDQRAQGFGAITIDRIVALAIAKFHPELVEQATKAAQDHWDVTLEHPLPRDMAGTSHLAATGDTLALTRFLELVSHRGHRPGPTRRHRPPPVRRAKAIGIIADPDELADLLTRADHDQTPAPTRRRRLTDTVRSTGPTAAEPAAAPERPAPDRPAPAPVARHPNRRPADPRGHRRPRRTGPVDAAASAGPRHPEFSRAPAEHRRDRRTGPQAGQGQALRPPLRRRPGHPGHVHRGERGDRRGRTPRTRHPDQDPRLAEAPAAPPSPRSSTSTAPRPATSTTHPGGCASWSSCATATASSPGAPPTPAPATSTTSSPTTTATTTDPTANRAPPGQTHPENLAALCRKHHRVKTFAGWSYRRTPDGSYRWKDPYGNIYLVDKDGTRNLNDI